MKVYLKDKKALAYFQEKASPEFWDKHWQSEDLRKHIISCTSDNIFIPAVKKYLPTKSVVLEGGCGRGHLVHALQYQGYQSIGIDFAPQTINNIKQAVPELDVRLGDIRNLPIEDNYLDGYISVGVIEHFWDGYEDILVEMKRTIKKQGLLFISFPSMSPLRSLKAIFGIYTSDLSNNWHEHQDIFYQFALNKERVIKDLQSIGFSNKEVTAYDGIKGLKDELILLKPLLQEIYDNKKYPRIKPFLDKSLKTFAYHCSFLVMEKL